MTKTVGIVLTKDNFFAFQLSKEYIGKPVVDSYVASTITYIVNVNILVANFQRSFLLLSSGNLKIACIIWFASINA